jgi:hypothetical protein
VCDLKVDAQNAPCYNSFNLFGKAMMGIMPLLITSEPGHGESPAEESARAAPELRAEI